MVMTSPPRLQEARNAESLVPGAPKTRVAARVPPLKAHDRPARRHGGRRRRDRRRRGGRRGRQRRRRRGTRQRHHHVPVVEAEIDLAGEGPAVAEGEAERTLADDALLGSLDLEPDVAAVAAGDRNRRPVEGQPGDDGGGIVGGDRDDLGEGAPWRGGRRRGRGLVRRRPGPPARPAPGEDPGFPALRRPLRAVLRAPRHRLAAPGAGRRPR